MIKRANFSQIEIKVIRECINSDIYPSEIAEMLGKDEVAIKRKMWKLGIRSRNKVPRRILTEDEKAELRKKAVQQQLEAEKKNLEARMSINPCLSSQWQDILSVTGAKVGYWRGQRTMLMDDFPVSVQQIKDRYERLISCGRSIREAAVVEQSYQSNHQNTEMAEQPLHNH